METSVSSKTMNDPATNNTTMRKQFQRIENPMSERIDKIMDTQTISTAVGRSKQKFLSPKFMQRCATCAALLALALSAPRAHAAAPSNANTTSAAAEEQQGKQRAGDRVVVTLSDPARPSTIKASLIHGELDVDDVNGSVTLNKIAGSAVAHALNGKLLVSFTRINQKPMAFSSLNGDIDVTFPADLKANVSLRSDNGDVLSDFDVNMTPQSSQPVVEDGRSHGGKYKVKIDKTVRGSINGGGPERKFTNFNGGIYIPKSGA